MSPPFKSIDQIADEKVGPDRWISRTGYIGSELSDPMANHVKNQKSVVVRALEKPLLQPDTSEALKYILHTGYWRFKPEHYQQSLRLKDVTGKRKQVLRRGNI